MYRIKVLLLSLVVLSSCEEEEEIFPYYYVDPTLEIVLNEFIREANTRGIEITFPTHFEMRFDSLDSPGLTQRKKSTNEWARIFIDDRYKEVVPENDIFELVVFHELGHALYQMNHTNDYTNLMYVNLHTKHQLHWIRNRDIMLDRFFDNAF